MVVVFSLKLDKTRFCYNCKHFISDVINGVEFGKCSAFPKVSDDSYYYCGTARSNSDMCGEDGALYRKKYNKNLGNDKYRDNIINKKIDSK